MKLRILLFLPILIAVSCKDDNAPTTKATTLYTLNVDATYTTTDTDNWIVIHDSNGELLDYKSFESGNNYVFTTDKTVSGDLIITTIVHTVSSNGRKFYGVESYTNVAQGMVRTLTLSPNLSKVQGTKSGEFTVEVDNIGPVDEYTLGGKFSSSGASSYYNNTLTVTSEVFSQPSKYILQIATASQLKYKLFDNIEPGKTYTVSYADMLAFDKSLVVNFPVTSSANAFVLGAETQDTPTGNQYTLLSHFNFDQHSNLTLGYLNTFPFHRTVLYLEYPTYELNYDKFGTPMELTTWPDPNDYGATSKSITNFTATAKKPVLWRSSIWQYSSNDAPYDIVNWSINSPNLSHMITSMPAEIIASHPLLSLDKLNYIETFFYTKGQTYQEYMDWQYSSAGLPVAERLSIGVH